MKDTLLIAGLIDSDVVKNKYKYNLGVSDSISVNEIFETRKIELNKIYWRKGEGKLSSNEKVKFFDYPGETLWPKKKESTLTEVLLKTVLRDNGFSYEYSDINDVIGESDIAKATLSGVFRSISLSTTHIHDQDTLISVLKIIRKYNKAPIILGGRYSSDNYQNLKELFGSLINYVIKYDGEEGYVGLLKCLCSNKKSECFNAVSNLIWNDGETLVENTYKTFDIDKKLYPDWSLAKYGKDYIFYEAARGCNFRCRFCTYWMAERKLIYKSAETIFDEWSNYYKKGIRTIKVYDSTFAYPPERLIALCKMLIKNNIKLRWSCYSRSTDIVNESMAKLMAKAGCELVSIGIESGSDIILKNMNKRATIKNHENALIYLENAGIMVQCGFVIGFPGETRKTVCETYKFIIKNRVRLANIQPFTIRSLNMLILAPKFRDIFKIKLTKIDQDHYDWAHTNMNLNIATELAGEFKNKLLEDKKSSVSFRYYLNVDNCQNINPYFFYDANALIQRIYYNILNKKSTKLNDDIIAELFDKYFIYEN